MIFLKWAHPENQVLVHVQNITCIKIIKNAFFLLKFKESSQQQQYIICFKFGKVDQKL